MHVLPGIDLHAKIFESASSVVYRGIRADGLAIVAKLLKQDYPSPQEITRYRQEYQITRSLNLEGVVKAYSQKDYQRTLVILLEDFGGESLEHWIRQHPDFCPMPLSVFLKLAINLTDILGRIHASSVIHRDINPGNIVLNSHTNVVKIIDFGIATRFSRTNPAFKSPYVLEGTIAYLSPEQTGRMNRLIDYRTDFYSLGVTFYELLTGQLPFPTTDILELVHCHIAKSPLPAHELNASIPKPVSDIVMKLMAKNAEDRYQSNWGLKADLEAIAAQLDKSGHIDHIQLGLQDVSDQFRIPQKLYGREAEVGALLTAFDRVTERVNGGEAKNSQCNIEMILVSGYAGIGKSALVQELYRPITKMRGYFIWGKFDQFQRNIPYSAIVDALRKLVLYLLSEPEEQVQAWRSQLLNALGSNGQLVIDVIPEVELIVGKQPPLPEVGSTEAQNRFNFVFQKFIRACCSYEHPLVIFLDDLQWADSATLKLIELILSDRATQSLLLIGAYRDNEVNQAHPLIATIDKLKLETITIHQIMLAPLTLGAVSQLISETLHAPTELIAPLAELVWRKTNGNPYFTNEFLKILHAQDLITFNINQQRWQWDVKQIKAKNITDNVVELMIQKLKQLPEQTQRVLRLAACIGAEFDLATLSAICERAAVEIFSELSTVIQSELILSTSELDENLLIQNYKFSHDRLQQAAYTLIAEEQKQAVHLQIGCLLLQSSEPETIPYNLFEVIDHLNLGRNLVVNQQHRDRIAKLNLIAGQKAQKTLAHSAAQQYLVTGIALLVADSWQFQYALTLALHKDAAKAAYLCGDFQQMEHWASVVLKHANTVLDKIEVYETKIQNCMVQGRQVEAIKIGLEVLELLGVAIPKAPIEADVQEQLEETVDYFNAIDIKDLLELPLMKKPDKLAAMQILSSLVGAAFQSAPLLLPLIILEQTNLSVQYGNTSSSTFAYAAYGGVILNGIMGDFERAYQFGELALGLTKQLDSKKFKPKVTEMVAAHLMHCKAHIRHTLPLLQETYETGLEIGDLEFSMYAAGFRCLYLYFAGLELTKVTSAIKIYSDVLAQFKQENILIYFRRLQQVAFNLLEQVENPGRLLGDHYNEEHFLPIHLEANDRTHLYYLFLDKLTLNYLFEDFPQAVEYASQAELYLDGVAGTFSVSLFYFYDSLAQIQLYQSISSVEQEHLLLKINNNQAKMQKWAYSAPVNFQHKYELVEAEKARILGQLFEAEELYEQAIQGARDNEYLQEEALTYELAAKFYLSRGREKFAQTYMKEAHYCYERWGATAKVKDLETRYPQFFPQPSRMAYSTIHAPSGSTSSRSDSAFNLAAVLKASQAISNEIELDRLLNSLMQILIENAGAQTGYLLLENAGAWAIQAACEFNTREQVCSIRVLQTIPTTNCLSESIVQYVIRTHEPVILSDATREGNFAHDPYIQQNQTQSILCFPLLNQSKLVGVLYLENQLAAGAFTHNRIQVLHLLSTQAAIAIENAKLYAKLRRSESQMTQFLEAIPVGIGIIDAAGRPYYANQRGIQLMGKGIDPSVAPDQIAEVYQFYTMETDQIYPTERLPIIQALRGESSTVDDIDIRQNNVTIPVEVWGSPVFDEHGKVAYAIAAFQDITERKKTEHLLANYNRMLEQQVSERTLLLSKEIEERQQVENALRQSEEQRRLTMDFSYIGTWKWNIVENTSGWDDNYARLLGLVPGEVEKSYQVWRDQVHQEDIDRVEQTIETALATHIDYETEYRVVYPDGSIHWLVSRGRGIYNNAGQAVQMLGVILDISDRKRAEEASILDERNRMAREIHDTLAQSFTGILLQVGAAGQVLTDDIEATQAHLEMIEELARTGLAEARRSVTALRPQLLEDGSLQSALHRLVAQMRSAADSALIYEMQGVAYSLPTEVENNLLRIGQEALTNAIKYAYANEIRVELVYADAQCTLRIKDNGRGFGLGNASLSSGFGLLGMSERAERIGAQLRIESQPGQGTEIIVTVNQG
ncbi:MAG: AAA family ATPase [Anaerolineae bacterium]|nr:AAA family ATPase [Gloeobacterales cyanobacterium ES-bin-313]